MKQGSYLAIIIAIVALMANMGCGSSVEDQPQMPDVGSETTDSVDADSVDADPFIPYTGPIQPLTEYLRPVLTEGKKWISVAVYVDGRTVTRQHKVSRDSIVDGRNVRLIRCDDNPDTDHIVSTLMREDNGNVDYAPGVTIYRGEQATWLNLFNVNAQSGDSVVGTCKVVPLSRGVITLMGHERRAVKTLCVVDHKLYAESGRAIRFDYWVEGIGMLFGHFPETSWVMTSPWNYPIYRKLLECWDGDTKIYDHREFKESLYQPIEVYAEPSDFPDNYSRWEN